LRRYNPAPLTLDLQEELLIALPPVVRGLSRPFATVAAAVQPSDASNASNASNAAATERPPPRRNPPSTPTAAAAAAAAAGGLASVRVGQVDLTVSFTVGRCSLAPSNPVLKAPTASAIDTVYDELHSNVSFRFNLRRHITALPFLPWGVRSIGAVDRARVTLGAFQLPSPSSSSSSSSSFSSSSSSSSLLSAEQVGALAARHYGQGLTLVHVRAQHEHLQDTFMSKIC